MAEPAGRSGYLVAAYFAAGASERLFRQRAVDVGRHRLGLRVDLVGDVELVGDLAAAVERVERLLPARSASAPPPGVRNRVPGMNLAYSSGGTPARPAMIFTASSLLAGSLTKVAIRFQTFTNFTQSARRCGQALRVDADQVVDEAGEVGAGEDRLRAGHRLERLARVRLPGADGVDATGGQRLRRLVGRDVHQLDVAVFSPTSPGPWQHQVLDQAHLEADLLALEILEVLMPFLATIMSLPLL